MEVCKICNGKGVLLETLRSHSKDNPNCGGECPNLLIELCPNCLNNREIDWVKEITRNITPCSILTSEVIEEIEKITGKIIFSVVFSYDAKDNLFITAYEGESNEKNI